MHTILPHDSIHHCGDPVYFLSSSPPTCIAMFVHGDHIYDNEDEEIGHEEL